MIKMEKEKVIELLRLYPEIDGEIKVRKNIVIDLEQYYNPLSAIRYDGLLKKDYPVSIPTEEKAIHIPDYVREEIEFYQKEIKNLQKIKVEILKEVSRLNLKHKKIIFGFYFNRMRWDEIAERINYSDRQCKNIRDEAIIELTKAFSKNSVLSGCKIKE